MHTWIVRVATADRRTADRALGVDSPHGNFSVQHYYIGYQLHCT
jgi:hypothetical protein